MLRYKRLSKNCKVTIRLIIFNEFNEIHETWSCQKQIVLVFLPDEYALALTYKCTSYWAPLVIYFYIYKHIYICIYIYTYIFSKYLQEKTTICDN